MTVVSLCSAKGDGGGASRPCLSLLPVGHDIHFHRFKLGRSIPKCCAMSVRRALRSAK